jgi:YHS domain-containing protein
MYIPALIVSAMVLAALPAHPQSGTGSGSSAQTSRERPAPMSMGQPIPEGKVTKVSDNTKICMVTNRAYDKPQIPVRVDGKTYYGCCDMCKSMLTNNADQRTAVDPVSKQKVDKSAAVIGVTTNGGVIYFKNDKDLEEYNQKFDSK